MSGGLSPKKKHTHSRTRKRRASNWTIKTPTYSHCPNCKQAKLPHVVCPNCGWYKGRIAIEVD